LKKRLETRSVETARSNLFAVVVVPFIAALVAIAGRSRLDAQWQDVVTSQLGFGAQGPSLGDACTTILSGSEPCNTYSALALAIPLAVVAALLTLVALALIALAARLATTNPIRLAEIFRPVLVTTILEALILIAMDGILVIVTVWFGEPALTDARHPYFAFAAAIVVAVAAWHIASGVIRTGRAAEPVFGDAASRAEAPRLWSTVDDVAATVGTESPDNMVLGLSPQMFVTKADVLARKSLISGRTMFLSLPFMHALTVAELRAVVGHELGHFSGGDLEVSTRFYPIYRRASHALQVIIGASRATIIATITLLSAYGVLRFFMVSFASVERSMARDRELAADQVGARIAGDEALATALVKIAELSPIHIRLLRSLPGEARGGRSVGSLADEFAEPWQTSTQKVQPQDLDTVEIAHPTDTHPPLSARLRALGTTSADVLAGDLDPHADRSIDLIDDAPARERALIEDVVAIVGRPSPRPAAAVRSGNDDATTSDWRRPAVLRALAHIKTQRGGSLFWITVPRGDWRAINDLVIGPYANRRPLRSIVSKREQPKATDPWLVLGLASAGASDAEVLKAGTTLRPVAVRNPGVMASTLEEICFVVVDGSQQGKLVSVRTVGHGLLTEGLAGSLIVPKGELSARAATPQREMIALIEDALNGSGGEESPTR
jgi:Zn-dependent protease with chaperone function